MGKAINLVDPGYLGIFLFGWMKFGSWWGPSTAHNIDWYWHCRASGNVQILFICSGFGKVKCLA